MCRCAETRAVFRYACCRRLVEQQVETQQCFAARVRGRLCIGSSARIVTSFSREPCSDCGWRNRTCRLEARNLPLEDQYIRFHRHGQYRLQQMWLDQEPDVAGPPTPGRRQAPFKQGINFQGDGAENEYQNIREPVPPEQDQQNDTEARHCANLEEQDFLVALQMAREEFNLDFAAAIGQQAFMMQDIRNLTTVMSPEPRRSELDLVSETEQQALILQDTQHARTAVLAVPEQPDVDLGTKMEQQELILQEIRNQTGVTRQTPRDGGDGGAEPLPVFFVLNQMRMTQAGREPSSDDEVLGPFGIVRRRSNERTTISRLPCHGADEIVVRDAFGGLVLDRPVQH